MRRRFAISIPVICLLGCDEPPAPQPRPWAPAVLSAEVKSVGLQTQLHGGDRFTDEWGRVASYVDVTGLEMIGPAGRSFDNGVTWLPALADPGPEVPAGSRRWPFTELALGDGVIVQPVIAIDAPADGDPEPANGLTDSYMRFRVSTDGGASFGFDEPMFLEGRDPVSPFPGVEPGRNGYFLGDVGSRPVVLPDRRLLVPLMYFPLAADGSLDNPGGGATSYSHVLVVHGSVVGGTLEWTSHHVIEGDPSSTTRGLMEPTVAGLPDGRLLMVCRGSNGGSNDPDFSIPGYKWYATSSDDGETWSSVNPWFFDDGTPFYSPSSMSVLIPHSSGRLLWAGNMSDENPHGNNPRDRLVIGEVHPATGLLVRSSLIDIDHLRETDTDGVNLSHVHAYEDRETSNVVIPIYRYNQSYTQSDPVIYEVSVGAD